MDMEVLIAIAGLTGWLTVTALLVYLSAQVKHTILLLKGQLRDQPSQAESLSASKLSEFTLSIAELYIKAKESPESLSKTEHDLITEVTEASLQAEKKSSGQKHTDLENYQVMNTLPESHIEIPANIMEAFWPIYRSSFSADNLSADNLSAAGEVQLNEVVNEQEPQIN